MANVLTSAYSVLPYGMLLTTFSRACDLDSDNESDIRVSKPSVAIDHACITRLGYDYNGRRWVEKAARAPAVVDVDTDEEAKMDIHPPSPTTPPSASSTAAGSSSTLPDYYQRLSQHLDTMSLDF